MANYILRNISQNIVTHMSTVFCEIFRKYNNLLKTTMINYKKEINTR